MSRRAAPRSSIPPPPAPIPTSTQGAPPIPAYAGPDIIQTINASGNVSQDDGAPTTIDVVPDMRFHLISWIYSIQNGLTASDYQASPFASPASVLAYTITMMIGLLYFGDSISRHAMSPAAAAVFNNNNFAQFFELLLDLPVPIFAQHEFSSLMYFLDPLALNLMFTPNLGLSEFLLDFGRHFPAAIFFQLHNLQASLPANASPSLVLRRFYQLTVANVTFDNGATQIPVTPSMYFGLYHPAAAPNANRTYRNWLNIMVNRIITSQAIRPVFTAPTIGPLPVAPVAFANNAAFNAYTYLAGISQENIAPMTQAVRSIGNFITKVFPTSKPLRAYTQAGSESITRHLIFDYPVPTWTTDGTQIPDAAFPNDNLPQSASHNVFATLIAFATAPANPATAPDGASNFFNAAQLVAADPPVNENFARRAHIINNAAPPAGTVDPINWIANYSDANPHLRDLSQPACLIFDPFVSSTAHLAVVMTSGIIIEEGSLSSVSVPLQRPESLLFSTNAHHINGAIPFSAVNNAILGPTDFHFRPVRQPQWPAIAQAFTLGLIGQLRIPVLRHGIVQTDVSTGMTRANSRPFPGSTNVSHNRFIGAALNYFGLTVGTATPDHFPSIKMWSSYRYESQVANSNLRYMLPSLRPIFGTRSRTTGSLHPATRIP